MPPKITVASIPDGLLIVRRRETTRARALVRLVLQQIAAANPGSQRIELLHPTGFEIDGIPVVILSVSCLVPTRFNIAHTTDGSSGRWATWRVTIRRDASNSRSVHPTRGARRSARPTRSSPRSRAMAHRPSCGLSWRRGAPGRRSGLGGA